MCWAGAACGVALVAVMAAPVSVAAARQQSVYVVPLRPACDPSTIEGEGVRLAFLSPEFNTASTPVVAPWQRFVGESLEDPRSVLSQLDFARCLHRFVQGLSDASRLADIEQALERALALIGAESGAPPPAMASAGPPYRTGRDVPMPTRSEYRAPEYPSAAEEQQISGTVFVEAVIDPSGSVRRTRIVGSIPPLDAAAEAAVLAWRYQPSVVNGQRVEVVHIAALRFSTAGESAADYMDIARFHYVRRELPNASAALMRALQRVGQERATLDPDPVRHLLSELSRARRYLNDRSITAPAVITQLEPKYTQEALKRKIQGTVEMDVAVLTDGTIGAVRIVNSLDPVHGLDVAAVRTAKEWRFRPATDASGTHIPVIVTLMMEFRMR